MFYEERRSSIGVVFFGQSANDVYRVRHPSRLLPLFFFFNTIFLLRYFDL